MVESPASVGPVKKPVQWERVVGGVVFAAVGALVVVAGLAFAVKLAWDAGMLRLSDAGKCVVTEVVGLVLLGVAEVVRRKLGSRASAAIFAAGIGAMYVGAWVSYGLYGLIPAAAALVLMAIVAAIGVGVSVHARVVSVAALSVFGAYAAPLLARGDGAPAWALPLYVCAVTSGGLLLSLWRTRYRVLRVVCWWPVLIMGTAWMAATVESAPVVAVAFTLVIWGLLHGELSVSARRGDGEMPAGVMGPPAPGRSGSSWRPIASSFSTTAWCAAFSGVAFEVLSPGLVWLGPLGFAGGALMLALVLAGDLRWLSERPVSHGERLGVAWMSQCGALVIAAIGWGLSGWFQGLAAVGLGVSAAVVGRVIRSPGLVLYGVIALALATLRVMLLDWMNAQSAAVASVSAGGLVLTGWMGVASVTIAAWGAVHWCAEAQGARWRQPMTVLSACVSAACLMWLPVHQRADMAWVVGWWVIVGGAIAALGRLRGRLDGLIIGDSVMLLSVVAGLPVWWASPPSGMIAGLVVSPGVVPLFMASALLLVRAEMWRRVGAQALRVGIGLVFLAVGVLAGAVWHPDAGEGSVVIGWAVIAAGAFGGLLWRPEFRSDAAGGVVCCVGLFLWASAYPVRGWAAVWDGALLLHPGLWTSVALASVLAGGALSVGWLRARGRHWSSLDGIPSVLAGGAVVLMLVSTSYEVARGAGRVFETEAAQRGALSVWWGVFAIGLLIAGAVRRKGLARYAGLAMLSAATLKAALFDLASVGDAVRMVSFIALGVMLLGVSAGYLSLTRRGRDEAVPDAD